MEATAKPKIRSLVYDCLAGQGIDPEDPSYAKPTQEDLEWIHHELGMTHDFDDAALKFIQKCWTAVLQDLASP
jgi:hypothetical protein